MDLPESNSKTVVAAKSLSVTIARNGEYTFNGKTIGSSGIERSIRREVSIMENRENATLTIAAEKGVPFKKVTELMIMAGKMRMKAIIATHPKS